MLSQTLSKHTWHAKETLSVLSEWTDPKRIAVTWLGLRLFPQFMCSVRPCAQHRPSLLYQSFPVGSLPALFCSWKQKQTNSLCHWCYRKSLWPKEISWNKINQSWASQSSKNWAGETACSVKGLAYHFQSPGFGPHTAKPGHGGTHLRPSTQERGGSKRIWSSESSLATEWVPASLGSMRPCFTRKEVRVKWRWRKMSEKMAHCGNFKGREHMVCWAIYTLCYSVVTCCLGSLRSWLWKWSPIPHYFKLKCVCLKSDKIPCWEGLLPSPQPYGREKGNI